jgi:hypothetical protein
MRKAPSEQYDFDAKKARYLWDERILGSHIYFCTEEMEAVSYSCHYSCESCTTVCPGKHYRIHAGIETGYNGFAKGKK